MNEIYVVNVKCGWCSNTLTKELEKIWVTEIKVWFESTDSSISRKLSFHWNKKIVLERLLSLWYPEVWTEESKSILKKAKSFVSCAIWKIN